MSPREILDRLLTCGLVGEIRPTPLFTDEPKLPVYTAHPASDEPPHARLIGQGSHPDPDWARLKAAAELVERIALSTPTSLRQGPFGAFEGQVDPADFCSHRDLESADALPGINEIRAAPLNWVEARRLPSGAGVLLPAQLVFLGLDRQAEPRIRPELTSSGGALGEAGAREALARGVFELLERDAFSTAWAGEQELASITGLPDDSAALLALLARYRLDCRVFALPAKLDVPAVLALTLDRSGVGPAVTAGLSAAETYDQAIRSAILESVAHRRAVRMNLAAGDIPLAHTHSDIVSIETRIAYWSRPESLHKLPAWVESGPQVRLETLTVRRCDAHDLLERAASADMQVYEADLTPPSVAAAGFQTVRALVPSLHPLPIAEVGGSARHTEPHPFA